MSLFPSHHRGAPSKVQHHQWLAQFQERLQQLPLHVEHLERGPTATLATHLSRFAHGADNHVGLLGLLNGFALQLFAVLERRCPIEPTVLL